MRVNTTIIPKLAYGVNINRRADHRGLVNALPYPAIILVIEAAFLAVEFTTHMELSNPLQLFVIST